MELKRDNHHLKCIAGFVLFWYILLYKLSVLVLFLQKKKNRVVKMCKTIFFFILLMLHQVFLVDSC